MNDILFLTDMKSNIEYQMLQLTNTQQRLSQQYYEQFESAYKKYQRAYDCDAEGNYVFDNDAFYAEFQMAQAMYNSKEKEIQLEKENLESKHKMITANLESLEKQHKKNLEKSFGTFKE